MRKRLVLLTVGLWLALFVGQRLALAAFDLAHVSAADDPWGIWALTALCAAVAPWFVGRWRRLAGRQLVLLSLVTLPAVLAAWFVTEAAVLFTPVVGMLPQSGEIASRPSTSCSHARQWLSHGGSRGWRGDGARTQPAYRADRVNHRLKEALGNRSSTLRAVHGKLRRAAIDRKGTCMPEPTDDFAGLSHPARRAHTGGLHAARSAHAGSGVRPVSLARHRRQGHRAAPSRSGGLR